MRTCARDCATWNTSPSKAGNSDVRSSTKLLEGRIRKNGTYWRQIRWMLRRNALSYLPLWPGSRADSKHGCLMGECRPSAVSHFPWPHAVLTVEWTPVWHACEGCTFRFPFFRPPQPYIPASNCLHARLPPKLLTDQ